MPHVCRRRCAGRPWPTSARAIPARLIVIAVSTFLMAIISDGASAADDLPEGGAVEQRQHGDNVHVEILGATDAPRNQPYRGSLRLTNRTDTPVPAQIELSLQRDGRLYSVPLPEAVHGSDHALAARSWTVASGETIAENTLTDGLDYTSAETAYKTDYWQSADQHLELGSVREVRAMGWRSGDANWIRNVDVSASLDGEAFAPVPELQNVDMYKKWGTQRFPAFRPFRAKVIKLHYHYGGQKTNIMRMPSALHVWDGVADEQIGLPQAGSELQRLRLLREVPVGVPATVDFEFKPKLPTGQYLIAAKVDAGGYTHLATGHILVEPAELERTGEGSRFGLNAAHAPLAKEHRKLGIGWVRFENFKWPMVSPAPHQFAFDGSVQPWSVDIDQITKDYRDAGLHVLPMMFLTPRWASGADDTVPQNVRLSQPPKLFADFAEFAFQSVSRYGIRRVDPSKLLTADRLTGLGRIKYFELGNEPNLNPLRDSDRPPTWGAWAGTMRQWWEMWRLGVEAVKRADPEAVVSSPGLAGMTSEIVDQMRVHKYDDGKCPLDFVDVINVHFYSGRTPPEIATVDANNAQGYEVPFPEHLKRLVEWRDRHKPGTPIWMSETGYDTAGPIGTNQWTQAARLPRVVALCLAGGLDKVFVYRESGSTASQHAASGVLRNDFSRRPSWYTYATLIRQLHRAEAGRRLLHENEAVWLQTWRRDGRTMLMAYCITGTANLGIELGKATVTDAFGGATKVDSTRDLQLSEFPLYLSDFSGEEALRPFVEEAQRHDEARRQRRLADARRTVYLFNFGDPDEPVGTNIGRMRYYQPVPASRLYDAASGFGFVGEPATKNDFRHWMRPDVSRHAVKFDKDQVFRCDVEPGSYELRIEVQPWRPSGDLILEGAVGGPKALTFSKGGGETIRRGITVEGNSLELKGTYQHLLRWMVLEKVPSTLELWDASRPVPRSADLATLEGVEFHVIKRREPEVDGYNWLHGVALAWHKGRLFASFGHNQGSENTASEVANCLVSDDGGRTWGSLQTIDRGDKPGLAVSHGVFLSHGGTLWAMHGAFYGRLENVHTRAYLFDPQSGAWQPKGMIVGEGFWPMQGPQRMGDGNFIMAGIRVAGGFGGTDDPAAVAISHGTDLTRWRLVVLPKPPKMASWGESAVIIDGRRLLNIARYRNPIALAATSRDYGRTWSTIGASNLPMAASKPYAGVLSTGQRYLICTTTSDAGNRRAPLTIAVGRPGENRFCKVYRIRDAVHEGPGESGSGCSLAYPYAVERHGRLYVAYSNDGGRGVNRNSAEMAVIPVESLRAK